MDNCCVWAVLSLCILNVTTRHFSHLIKILQHCLCFGCSTETHAIFYYLIHYGANVNYRILAYTCTVPCRWIVFFVQSDWFLCLGISCITYMYLRGKQDGFPFFQLWKKKTVWINKATVPDNTKRAKKFGYKLFRDMKFFYLVVTNELRMCSKCFVLNWWVGDRQLGKHWPLFTSTLVNTCNFKLFWLVADNFIPQGRVRDKEGVQFGILFWLILDDITH